MAMKLQSLIPGFRTQRGAFIWVVGITAIICIMLYSIPNDIEREEAHSNSVVPVSYTHLRAHETREDLVCRLLLEKKKK